jgi:putative flippase GtrA
MTDAALRRAMGEGSRYLAASAAAFAVDFGVYAALIHLASVDYLIAAPIGFAGGLATIYLLSIAWVFDARRMADARKEFAVFAAIGLAGMALNQLAIYLGVAWGALSYELAKLGAAGAVFCFNFALRKLLLFTRY